MKYENFFYEKYKKNVFSQNGEDGVIEEILKRLNLSDRWCCEFGAWDGVHLSNTYKLITEGYNAVLIEGDSQKFSDLERTCLKHPNIVAINKFVNTKENSLDSILSQTDIPKDFTLLSVDIDSNDYYIWDSLKDYNPIVVVIEITSEINPFNYEHIHNDDKGLNLTSFGAMYELGKKKGYEFVCHTGNMIFVRNDHFHKLNLTHPENPVYNFRRWWIEQNKGQYIEFLSQQS